MESLRWKIGGMSCAACSSRIEKVVGRTDGVAVVNVNLTTGKADIQYDERRISPDDLRAVIERLGFSVLADPDAEQQKLYPFSRFVLAAVATVLLMYVSMGAHMLGLPLPAFFDHMLHPLNFALLQLAFTLPVLYAGRRFFTQGIPALLRGGPNMDSLIALGTGAALIYSIYSIVMIILGDSSYVNQLYFETAAMIITLVLLGKFLEERSKGSAADSVRKLLELTPDTALVERDAGVVEVPTYELQVGDIVQVKAGARIPADGVLVEGYSAVNEAFLTGESLPREVEQGSEVKGGSINGAGFFRFQTTQVGKDTVLAQIVRMMEEAQSQKAPIARLADKVAGVFVPVVLVIALVAAIAWAISGQGLVFSLRIFIAVLVIACPCALGLATPTAITVGMGKGASMGILIKNAAILEGAAHGDTVMLDKTGTITQGRPQLTDLVAAQGVEEGEVLRLAAALEAGSEHPLAAAFLEAAQEKSLELPAVGNLAILTGRGLAADLREEGGTSQLYLGNRRLMQEQQIDTAPLEVDAERLLAEGKTVVYLAQEGNIIGLVAIADQIKPDSAASIAKLQEMGIRTVMLTGDNRATAEVIAKAAGVDEVAAELLPQDKVAEIKKQQAAGHKVVMVGDGINDAPALLTADIGIAIGTGADIAIDSADIVLTGGDLSSLTTALRLSRHTLRIIKQNLVWAFCYNILGIPIAAGVLYLFGGPLLNPVFGALAMSLSSVSVVSNALRIKKFK